MATYIKPAGIWALDFMPDLLYHGRTFRALNVTDESNREGLPCGRVIWVM